MPWSTGSRGVFGLRLGDQTFTLRLLARELAYATHRFGLLTNSPFRRLLVRPSSLHLTENAFALHLLLEDSHGLIDVVVANQDLQDVLLICESFVAIPSDQDSAQPRLSDYPLGMMLMIAASR
jgi:hypothetical protein